MRDQELAECCASEFERYVDELVSRQKSGEVFVASPIFTGSFAIDDIPKLKRLVRNALRARAWFARHGPAWSPPLPLSTAERIAMLLSDDNELFLVMLYSISLHARDYDFLGHPLFFDYARGLMADPRTPEGVREDPVLCAEYPGRPITGLDERGQWRPLPDPASKLIKTFQLPALGDTR